MTGFEGLAIARDPTTDTAVSPVIAVVLMVAIAVLLAASLYAWVGGVGGDEGPATQASISVKGFDADQDGSVDWIRLNLVRAEAAPFGQPQVAVSLTDEEGNSFHEDEDTDYDTADPILCSKPKPTSQTNEADRACHNNPSVGSRADWFGPSGSDGWSAGQSFYVPCQDASDDGSGSHVVTLTLRDSVVLDRTLTCEQEAQAGG